MLKYNKEVLIFIREYLNRKLFAFIRNKTLYHKYDFYEIAFEFEAI